MSQFDINATQVEGRLTREPELFTTSGGSTKCTLRIANNRGEYKGKDRGTNYFNVVVWGPNAANCAEHLSKGRQVFVVGKLQHREYEVEGQRRETVEIVADTVKFGSKPRPMSAAAMAGEAEEAELAGVAAGGDDSDIPF